MVYVGGGGGDGGRDGKPSYKERSSSLEEIFNYLLLLGMK